MSLYHFRRGLSPPVTLVLHGRSDFLKASNVGSSNQAGELALSRVDILFGSLEAVLEAGFHDALEFLIDFLLCPGDTLRVLGHLKTGDGHSSSVSGLAYLEISVIAKW